MTREEFYQKWDEKVEFSQSACNALALLNRAAEVLRDWRSAVWEENGEGRCGDWNGKDCGPFKFFLYQIVYLTFGREMDWPEWHEEYRKIERRLECQSTV